MSIFLLRHHSAQQPGMIITVKAGSQKDTGGERWGIPVPGFNGFSHLWYPHFCSFSPFLAPTDGPLSARFCSLLHIQAARAHGLAKQWNGWYSLFRTQERGTSNSETGEQCWEATPCQSVSFCQNGDKSAQNSAKQQESSLLSRVQDPTPGRLFLSFLLKVVRK